MMIAGSCTHPHARPPCLCGTDGGCVRCLSLLSRLLLGHVHPVVVPIVVDPLERQPRLPLQEWTKGRDIGLTMPLWTWAEMEKLVQHCYEGKVRGTLERWRRGCVCLRSHRRMPFHGARGENQPTFMHVAYCRWICSAPVATSSFGMEVFRGLW
jgi:hypothetical protein